MSTRLTPSFKVHFKGTAKSVIVFYIVMLALFVIDLILNIIFVGNNNSEFSGIEMIASIFFLVFGISCFKPNLKMAFANCVSRRTEFISTMLSAATYSFIMVFLNAGMVLLFSMTSNSEFAFNQMYSDYAFANGFIKFLTWFLYEFLSLFSSFALGYFIGALYYRMNKGLKIAVSAGVPTILLIGMPIAIGFFGPDSIFVKAIVACMDFLIKTVANPYGAILLALSSVAIFMVLAFLLIRKAPIKEQ
ncbi:MAG: hypothetical protein JG769_1985 [Oscillospiraceae bacterium]|jgi:hypothetical protein|nr:hypothetical protein [Oscillospiraceae bacterium]